MYSMSLETGKWRNTNRFLYYTNPSILLKMVQGPIPSNVNGLVYGNMLPLTSWFMFEILFKSSLVVVFMALLLHISAKNAFLTRFEPEIERIMFSLQFMFADTITPLLVDYRTKRLVLPAINLWIRVYIRSTALTFVSE